MLWDKLTVVEHFTLFATAYKMSDRQRDAAHDALLEELRFERYRDYRAAN